MSDQEHAVQQVRGSSVLLLGRVISLVVNLLLQLLLVRYFTKDVFGSFAFAWASVEFGVFVSALGLNKALARFVPMYQEAGDRARMRRAVAFTLAAVLSIGLGIIAGVLLLDGWLERNAWIDPQSLRLLRILIFLVPMDALGFVFQDLFVAFEDIAAVFMRRYVLSPGLRLTAVAGVMLAGGDAESMAYGYVAGGAIGLLLYLWLFYRLWRDKLQGESATVASAPPSLRKMASFGVAVFASQLGGVFRMIAVVFLLEFLRSSQEVGDYRAVLPFARLNLVVLENFTVAFVPAAARLLMRNEGRHIGRLVDTSSVWVTVFAFPVFLASFSFSPILSRYVLGGSYADTWPIMSVLAVGFLVETVLGFAPQVLRAHANLRPVLLADLTALLVNIVLALALTPAFGALGAAASVSISSIVSAVFIMIAARRVDPAACSWTTVGRLLAGVGTVSLAVAAIVFGLQPPLPVQVLLAVAGVAAVMFLNRRRLTVDDVFPELRRIPLVRWVIPRSPSVAVTPTASES